MEIVNKWDWSGASFDKRLFEINFHRTDGLKMVHSNEDALNKIPLKSASGLDDEEKNGGEFTSDTAAAEEARREQMWVQYV